MQFKFDTLANAKEKAKQLVGGELEDDSLQIIYDTWTGKFFVVDGSPMIRNFEEVIWTL